MNLPSRLIELLGGPKSVSDRLGKPLTTVASWASRESIPSKVWPDLIAFAREGKISGITYETLVDAHALSSRQDPAARPARRARGPGFRQAGSEPARKRAA